MLSELGMCCQSWYVLTELVCVERVRYVLSELGMCCQS